MEKKYSFYRPHARLQFDNVDPVTGEVMPSMTKQEFQAECDINNVIKSFSQTGMFRHVSAKAAVGTYEDLPDGIDFQEALHTVNHAREVFLTLPSKIRERFGHDPAVFLEFSSNPSNLAELRVLGLALPEAAPVAPVEVKIVNPVESGGAGGSPPAGGAKAP